MDGMAVCCQFDGALVLVSDPSIDFGLLSLLEPPLTPDRPLPRLAMDNADDDATSKDTDGAKPKAVGALRSKIAIERFIIGLEVL